jgi:hypothetical protein
MNTNTRQNHTIESVENARSLNNNWWWRTHTTDKQDKQMNEQTDDKTILSRSLKISFRSSEEQSNERINKKRERVSEKNDWLLRSSEDPFKLMRLVLGSFNIRPLMTSPCHVLGISPIWGWCQGNQSGVRISIPYLNYDSLRLVNL